MRRPDGMAGALVSDRRIGLRIGVWIIGVVMVLGVGMRDLAYRLEWLATPPSSR